MFRSKTIKTLVGIVALMVVTATHVSQANAGPFFFYFFLPTSFASEGGLGTTR